MLMRYIYIYTRVARASECGQTLHFRQHQTCDFRFTTSVEIEPAGWSFCRHGSCTFTEVARLVPSGPSMSLDRDLGRLVAAVLEDDVAAAPASAPV